MSKKTFFLAFAVLISAGLFSQSSDFDQQMGVSLKASTNGIGADLYYRPTKKLAVKAGVEYLSFNLSSDRIESFIDEDANVKITRRDFQGSFENIDFNDIIFNTDAKFKTGAISLSVGYQLFRMFYVTGGLGKSLFDTEARGILANDIAFTGNNETIATFTKDKIDPFIVDLKYNNSIIPYLGIGLGSYVPQNKKYSFALELGAYYVGSYSVVPHIPIIETGDIVFESSITNAMKAEIADGIAAINKKIETEVKVFENDVNDALESFKFYPVLKLTIGFNAFTLRK